MNKKAKELGNEPINRVEMTVGDCNFVSAGLTKHEYFTGLAMQGMLAREKEITPETMARWATKCANALLEELSKTE